MKISRRNLPCDGCGLPASPEHIAWRLRRLELSTRFRPVHIGILFVALAPTIRPEDDFYGPAESQEFFDPFLDAVEIPAHPEKTAPDSDSHARKSARLAEFQRRGYYLAYLSECPIPQSVEPAASTVARLAPTLIRRIRFNYKPKHIAPLGQELLPFAEMLRAAGIGPLLTLDQGLPLPVPQSGRWEFKELFRKSVATVWPRENLSPGYDRIEVRWTDRDVSAGGKS